MNMYSEGRKTQKETLVNLQREIGMYDCYIGIIWHANGKYFL